VNPTGGCGARSEYAIHFAKRPPLLVSEPYLGRITDLAKLIGKTFLQTSNAQQSETYKRPGQLMI